MEPAAAEISICPGCGRALEETSGGGLGCVVCLLRVGIGGDDAISEKRIRDGFEGDERFGVYEIDRREDGSFYELGRGAMGVTYRATDTSLQRKVALKIIKLGVATERSQAQERFLREARAAAVLRHENIATIFQFGIREETGQCFYAMELIEGETLEERVRRSGPLDAGTTIGIAQQVAAALIAAEKRSLIHRDLKPANLMLVNADEAEVVGRDRQRAAQHAIPGVKIIDFGLAKALNAPADPKRLTHNGFVGTPAFASPEQFENSLLDVRSDIYSLGATLWFALTGKTPFEGHSVEEIRGAQRSKALPFEQLKAAGVPFRLRSLLRSMLACEPAGRPNTHELATELRRQATELGGRRITSIALAAAAILIVLGASAFFIAHSLRTHSAQTGSGQRAGSAAPEKSIAVLPFENLSEDKVNAYFADGVQEEILTRLAKIADLKVISRTSTQRYQSRPNNLSEIAKQLGVANILEGSVQKVADQVRVNVQLVNAQTDSHLWADTYDRKLTDIFGVESEIAKAIADALRAKLSGDERRAIATRPTENIEAHQLYLKGLYFSNKRTGPDLRSAIEYFKEAIGKDPNYALAYAGLADAWALLSLFGGESPQETMPRAKAAAKKALERDETLPEAHNSLGMVLALYDFDFAQSKKEFTRAIELNPNYATAHHQFGNVNLSMVGEFDRAISEGNRAVELDPLSLIINADLGQDLMLARRYDEAIDQLRKTLAVDPRFYYARWILGEALQMKGRLPEALAEYRKAGEITDDPMVMALLAQGYAGTNQRNKAQELLSQLKQLSTDRHVGPFIFALADLAVANNEQAIDDLEKAYREHDPNLVGIKVEPLLDPLRGHPRFERLVASIVPEGVVARSATDKSIAVLPFENLSDEKGHTFFADGVHDDVLTKLAKIADLKVISRTSVMQYRGRQDLRQIGRALGVSHVLEGTVRRSDGRVHINAQLIDARTDTHVWAEEFDRELNDVFAIETELAQSIANHLRANVSSRETLALQERLTSNFVAFDLYTRAKNLVLTASSRSTGRTDLQEAVDLLNQAVAHDPSFLQAYCQLASAHAHLYSLGFDRTSARLDLANSAIQAAFRLRPDAGETHLARAENLYRGYRDYKGALAELEIARQSLPNDSLVFQLIGFIQRRQGHWDEATQELERASELDPLNTYTLQQMAWQYLFVGRYAEIKPLLARVLAIEPNRVDTEVLLASVDFHWRADIRPFHQMIDSIRATNPSALPRIADAWLTCALAERDPGAAANAMATMGENAFGDDTVQFSRTFVEGLVAWMIKDEGKVQSAFAAARADQVKTIQTQPNYGPPLCVLGLIDAALGRKEEALREGRRAVELLPVEKDAINGVRMIKYLSMIAAWVGDKDIACEQLAIAIRYPTSPSYGDLKLLPYWDPLRGDPRFEQIVASLAPKKSE
ncbi:MAG TPA: protein kinase [Candidatus Udaeobacter sp.]|jgi:TolB-like protein/predicted Zn-dependent protease